MKDRINKRVFLKKLGLATVAGTGFFGAIVFSSKLQKKDQSRQREKISGNMQQNSNNQMVQKSIQVNNVEQEQKIIEKLELSNKEWKERLTKEQYVVLRKEGTERPFTSQLNDEKRKGTYSCAGCDLELFTSEMKYDSRTGWPSFFTHIEGHIGKSTDYRLFYPRDEYHCIRCGGHQGHVFNDGPAPTSERWCNNGVALQFVPDTAKAKNAT